MCLNALSTMGTAQHNFDRHMEYRFQVNYHNCTGKSRAATWHFSDHHDTTKMNMWHGLLYSHVEGPFIFAENTMKRNINLSILKLSSFTQTEVTGRRRRKKNKKRSRSCCCCPTKRNTLHQLHFAQSFVTTNSQMHIHMHNSHGINNFIIAEQVTTNHMILCLKIASPLILRSYYFMDPLFPLRNLISIFHHINFNI